VTPIVALIFLLAGVIFLFGDETTSGPTQVALIMCTMIAGLVGLKNGHRWKDMGHAGGHLEMAPRQDAGDYWHPDFSE